jgi:hypothetical protein
MRYIASLFCAWLVCAHAAFAHSRGGITGTVLNLPGEAVPNAPVQQQAQRSEPFMDGELGGRREGDVLVVDTVGFNDRSWLDAQGHPHTGKMRVTERIRRPDMGHLEIELTLDDPGAYAKP